MESNLAYSLQYLEYIEKQLAELNLSSVLLTMLFKTYIITGMSIVEGLFTNLLKRNNKWNKDCWEKIKTIKSNETTMNNEIIKVHTDFFRRVDEYEMRMDLDSMLKRVEKKKLLSIDHKNFPILKRLRELRNRVHLHIGENSTDHDFNNFNYNEKKLMGQNYIQF